MSRSEETRSPERAERTVDVVRSDSDAIGVFGGHDLRLGIERAKRIATELRKIVDQQNLSVKIGTSEHLQIEAWTALGSISGVAPQTEWTRVERDPDGRFEGCTARVQVIRIATGEVISAAENVCFIEEQTRHKASGKYYHRWVDVCPRHDQPTLEACGLPTRHAVISMAQTRAASKALAQVLRWIVVLAGYSGTPAEEMTGDSEKTDPGSGPRGSGSPTKGVERVTREQVAKLREAIEKRAHQCKVLPQELEKSVLAEGGYDSVEGIPRDVMGTVMMTILQWKPPPSEGA